MMIPTTDNVAQALFDAIELQRVGNPYKRIEQIQMTPGALAILKRQLDPSGQRPLDDVVTVFGIPIVQLNNQKGEFFQFVYGFSH